eukprot:scaffold4905_cov159-Ochromonas_danica.AAC.1
MKDDSSEDTPSPSESDMLRTRASVNTKRGGGFTAPLNPGSTLPTTSSSGKVDDNNSGPPPNDPPDDSDDNKKRSGGGGGGGSNKNKAPRASILERLSRQADQPRTD